MAITRFRETDLDRKGGFLEYSWVPQERIELLKEMFDKLGRKWLKPHPQDEEEARQLNLHCLELLKDVRPFLKRVLAIAKPMPGIYQQIAAGLREEYVPADDAQLHLRFVVRYSLR